MCEVCVNAHFGQLHLSTHPLLKLLTGCTCQMQKAGSGGGEQGWEYLGSTTHTPAMKLYWAAEGGHLTRVKELIAEHADVNEVWGINGQTPLYAAAEKDYVFVVTELLKIKGIDVDKATTDGGRTPLFVAARQGHEDVVTMLITADADVDKANINGATPLYVAARNNHKDVVTKLTTAAPVRADVNKATTDGTTPLWIAAQRGHEDVVTTLIAAGALVDKAKTTTGSTPLLMAAQNGHTATVSKLLQHGADKLIRGWQNETPLESAQRNNHAAIVALLA